MLTTAGAIGLMTLSKTPQRCNAEKLERLKGVPLGAPAVKLVRPFWWLLGGSFGSAAWVPRDRQSAI